MTIDSNLKEILQIELNLVPRSSENLPWFIRDTIHRKLQGMVLRWGSSNDSEINVLWANFGQGKTHTLYYLNNLLNQEENTISLYSQLPSLSSGSAFGVFYKNVVAQFPLANMQKEINDRYPFEKIGNLLDPKIIPDPRVRKIYQLIYLSGFGLDEQIKTAATNYLLGERVLAHDLRRFKIKDNELSLPAAPKTSEDFRQQLETLIQVILDLSGKECKFVLMIDEFQRVSSLQRQKQQEIFQGLHVTFNNIEDRCGRFRMILAMSSSDLTSYSNYLSPDLRTRVTDDILLKELTPEEGDEFLKKILGNIWDNSHIKQDAIDLIIKSAGKMEDGLSPRTIKKVMNQIRAEIYITRQEKEDFNSPVDALEVSPLLKNINYESENDA